MRARFWGVRGSFPVCAPDVIRYGGNTPCVEVLAEDHVIIIDAGTGIRGLGMDLLRRGVRRVDLLLSHVHWDHIQGFPHFALLAETDADITVHALRHPGHTLADLLGTQQRQPYFPVSLDRAPARLQFVEHEEGESFTAGPARVTCRRLNHPGVTGGFRVEAADRVLAYLSDTDVMGERLHAAHLADDGDWLPRLRQGTRDLGHGADLLVCDTFFHAGDYEPDWGHSRVEDFLDFSAAVGAGSMCLFHHRPNRVDDELDAMLAALPAPDGVRVLAAAEGLEIAL